MQMGIALFFVGEGPRPDGQFLVFGGRRGGGPERLSRWFVHFLAQLGNAEKQESRVLILTML